MKGEQMKKFFGLIIAIMMMSISVSAEVLVLERSEDKLATACFQGLAVAKAQLGKYALETGYKLVLENGHDAEEKYYLGVSERNESVAAGKFFDSDASKSAKTKKLFFLEAQSCATLEREIKREARLRAAEEELALLKAAREEQKALNQERLELLQKLIEAVNGNTVAIASLKADLSVLDERLTKVERKIARCCKKKVRKHRRHRRVRKHRRRRVNYCTTKKGRLLQVTNPEKWYKLGCGKHPTGGSDTHTPAPSPSPDKDDTDRDNTDGGGTSDGNRGNTDTGGTSAGEVSSDTSSNTGRGTGTGGSST